MRRLARWFGLGLLGTVLLGLAVAVTLRQVTRGDYDVPALVTQNAALSAAVIGGHRLHLRIVDGPPQSDTVIVLHGGPGGDFRSLEALAALSSRHRMVFYDQRGAGLSERVGAEALTLDGYLDELSAVIDQVAPGQQVSLIGHSWGAMLATAFLGTAPERVKRAVLIEPGYLDAAGRDEWHRRRGRLMSGPGYLVAALMAGVRATHVTGPDPHASEDFLIGQMVHVFADHPQNPYHCGDGYDAPLRRFGALASAAWDDASVAEVDRIGGGAAGYGGPVLLLAGACNDWIGPAMQARHRDHFANATLSVIPDAGHDVVWDNPGETLAVIAAFLDPPTEGSGT